MTDWSPSSWTAKRAAQDILYEDPDELAEAKAALRRLPPLVTSFEVERLKSLLAEAQQGKRFVLQGGDCAETLLECDSDIIARKLKVLLQMSLVLVHGGHRPVVRIARLAGQYAKPRSQPTETKTLPSGETLTLPSYFGDLINKPGFTPQERRADPWMLVRGYQHAALTLNFVRSLTEGGFADLHHPEYWDLEYLMGSARRGEYQTTVDEVLAALRFMTALGDGPVRELERVEMFTSHEGLNLHYESAQTRRVPRRDGWYDLTTHLPWIGERTRQLDGAHIEFFRNIENPLGIKVGPTATKDDVLGLLKALNPRDEPGKIVLITRMGAGKIRDGLPPLIDAVQKAKRRVLWVSDPMHGNTRKTGAGVKTRNFDDVLAELGACMAVHEACGSYFGGVHLELTGDDVTECVGGEERLSEADLAQNYTTACDPRLNARQALEVSFRVAQKLKRPGD
ncbi:MAG: 3-deoxy-7-phosphoheptulonate synthase class II [Myxococcota bacterium]